MTFHQIGEMPPRIVTYESARRFHMGCEPFRGTNIVPLRRGVRSRRKDDLTIRPDGDDYVVSWRGDDAVRFHPDDDVTYAGWIGHNRQAMSGELAQRMGDINVDIHRFYSRTDIIAHDRIVHVAPDAPVRLVRALSLERLAALATRRLVTFARDPRETSAMLAATSYHDFAAWFDMTRAMGVKHGGQHWVSLSEALADPDQWPALAAVIVSNARYDSGGYIRWSPLGWLRRRIELKAGPKGRRVEHPPVMTCADWERARKRVLRYTFVDL